MRFAVPIADGRLCMHFGHCEQFALVDVAADEMRALTTTLVTPPPHEPGLLPRWLHGQGVNVVIAGGMGQRRSSSSRKAESRSLWSALPSLQRPSWRRTWMAACKPARMYVTTDLTNYFHIGGRSSSDLGISFRHMNQSRHLASLS